MRDGWEERGGREGEIQEERGEGGVDGKRGGGREWEIQEEREVEGGMDGKRGGGSGRYRKREVE